MCLNPGNREEDTMHESQNKPEQPAEAESVLDRRLGIDRRDLQDKENQISGLERRRGPGRRLSDFSRAAEEGELTAEQFLFVAAIDAFKRANGKTFPAWTDVLEVIRLLGYRKTQSSELGLRNLEDWLEEPDTPANVRLTTHQSDELEEEQAA
jgi:hypothetical protein